MPGAEAAHAGSTPERILRAADARFAIHGSANARLSDITADIGMTTGALYRNFDGKGDLQAALVARLAAAITTALGEVRGDREQAFDALLTVLDAHPGALRLLFERAADIAHDGSDPVVVAGRALRPHLGLALPSAREGAVATFLSRLVFHHTRAVHDGGLPGRVGRDVAEVLDALVSGGVYPDPAAHPTGEPPHHEDVRFTPFVRWQPSPEKVLPRSTKGIRTRQSIQDAAVRVFDRRGLTDTAISDIADEAGVASGSVYRYFVDKADILRSMQAEVEEAIIRESHLPLDDGRLAIREQMLTYLNCYQRNLGPIRAWRELAEPGSDMAAAWNGMRSNFIRRIVRVLQYGQHAGIARKDLDLDLVAQLHSIGYEAAAYGLYIRGDDSAKPRQLADTMHTLFVGGFPSVA